MLVVFTTVFMGSTVGILQKILFANQPAKKVKVDEDTGDQEPDVFQKLKNEKQDGPEAPSEALKKISELNDPEKDTKPEDDSSVENSSVSSYGSGHAHPNQKNEEREKKKKQTTYKGCAKHCYRFDNLVMKPMLIYKYEKN